MKAAFIAAMAIATALVLLQAQEQAAPVAEVRFQAIDVFLDSYAQPLAAYQINVAGTQGEVRIAGIEGGEHPAFKNPPYYDPKAMQRQRVILGAFSTAAAEQLPRGRTRVATIHLQITGAASPDFTARVEAAATSDGQPIAIKISLMERSAP